MLLQGPAKKPCSHQTPAKSQMCGFKATQQFPEEVWDLLLPSEQPENMVLLTALKRTLPRVELAGPLRSYTSHGNTQTLKLE